MKEIYLFLLLTSCGIFAPSSVFSANLDCYLNLEDVPKEFEPLFLKNLDDNLSFAKPEIEERTSDTVGTRKYIKLEKDEELIIACLGKDNLLKSNKQINFAKCKESSILLIDGKETRVFDLACGSDVTASILAVNSCGKDLKAIIYLVGFLLEGLSNPNPWIAFFEICHKIETSETIYTRHSIHGTLLPDAVYKANENTKFLQVNPELYEGIVNPDYLYSKRNQEVQLTQAIGISNALEMLDEKPENYMKPAYLTPPSDFLYGSMRANTNFYINIAAMFSTIVDGNWFEIEQFIRKFASENKMSLVAYTGTAGILHLQDVSGSVPLYLHKQGSEGKVPVPKKFWKLILDQEKKKCVIFIIINDPFIKKKPSLYCQDKCRELGWPVLQKDFKKGFMYCCTYKDMLESKLVNSDLLKDAIPDLTNDCTDALSKK